MNPPERAIIHENREYAILNRTLTITDLANPADVRTFEWPFELTAIEFNNTRVVLYSQTIKFEILLDFTI